MRFCKRIFVVLALILTCCFSVAEAVPVMPGVREHVQKDGSMVWYIPYGDEFLNYLTDMEGNLVAFGEDRDLYLAEWASEDDLRGNESGKVIILSSVKVQGAPSNARMAAPDEAAAKPMKNPPPPYVVERAHKGRNGSYDAQRGTSQSPQLAPWVHRPLSGTRKILVIRVEFSDKKFTTAETLHSGYLFGDDNSVKKYFADQSRNTLNVESALGGTIIKSVTLSTVHPDRKLNAATVGNSTAHFNEVAFVESAIAATGENLSGFDTNNDGYITPDELCIYLIVAGRDESAGGNVFPAVWAHAWSSWSGQGTGHYVDANGKIITDWAMNGEMYNASNPMGFAVIAHELGHQFCKLPDLYDTSYSNAGLGFFSLMASGSWGAASGDVGGSKPVNLDAWSRYYLGWETPQTTIAQQMTLKNPSVGNGNGSMKQSFVGDRATQYFLTEVRNLTMWDKGLERWLGTAFGGGLLVLHVDEEVGSGQLENGNNLNRYVSGRHQGVMAVEADGNKMSTTGNGGTIGSLWWNGNTASLSTNFAPPRSNFYTSATSNAQTVVTGIEIKGIGTVVSGAMTVTTFDDVVVTGVTLNKNTTTITAGSSETLTATVEPTNATNKAVTWTSSTPTVATVNASGLVTAVTAGTATITVTTTDGNKSATCTVTVNNVVIPVTGVTLNKSSTEIEVGSSETLTATIAPANATNKAVTWTSGTPTVATVNASGLVTAVTAGTATITATAVDGSGKSATCTVTVNTVVIPVTGVTLNKSSTEIEVGSSETLTATIAPTTATNKAVTWTSSTPAVATVNASGLVTAVTVGTANITVSSNADPSKSATCTVTVNNVVIPVTDVTLNKPSTEIEVGSSETLTATIAPATATDKTVTWTTNNSSVASVNNGVVTAVAVGDATITVTTTDGNKTATCNVTVTPILVASVSLKSSTRIEVSSSETLTATIEPSTATNKNVTWSTSSSDIAAVSNGTVTARKIGTATITATAVDGSGESASCTVTVFKTPPIPPTPKPEKPEGTPADVEPTTPEIEQNISESEAPAAITAAAGEMEHIFDDDLDVVEGVVVVKESVGLKIAQQSDPANKVLVPLPVFSADVGSGKTAMVSFGVSGDKLMASAPQNVKIMKVLSADKGEFFKYESAPASFTDKKFTIMSWGNAIFTGAIVPGGSYKLILFIKDGGSFDLDGSADKKVVDPAAIVGTSSTPGGGGSSPTPSSAGGGGGCSAVSTPLWWLLMGVIPLMVRRRK